MTNETISKIKQMETKKLVVIGIAVIFVLGLVYYAVALYAPQVSTTVGKVFSKSNETQGSNISFKENATKPRNKTSITCAQKPGTNETIDVEECARVKKKMSEEDYREKAEMMPDTIFPEYEGFRINSSNVEIIKQNQVATDPSRVRGLLIFNQSTLDRKIGILNGTVIDWLEENNISCVWGGVVGSTVGCYASVPISMLDEIENSGYFVGFGPVPIEDKVDKRLLKEAMANPDEVFPVEIRLFQGENASELVPYMQHHVDHVVGIDISRDDWMSQVKAFGELEGTKLEWSKRINDGFSGQMNGSEILKVAEYEFVRRISTNVWDKGGPGNANGLPAGGADILLGLNTPYTGAGINISFTDSGVAYNTTNPAYDGNPKHPDLPSPVYQFDYCDEDGIAEDSYHHGTHVTGIALGRGVNTSIYKGVAPGANLIMLKWLKPDGVCEGPGKKFNAVMEWTAYKSAQISSNSWGRYTRSSIYKDAEFVDKAVLGDYLDRDGYRVYLTVITIAGNQNNLVTDPGTNKNGITVGAAKIGNNDNWQKTWNEWNSTSPCTDTGEPSGSYVCFSNYGPITTDDRGGSYSRVKPDVIAPGYNITSTHPWYMKNAGLYYTRLSGTSMAAPYVAGISALLMEKDASFKVWPEAVKAKIINSAVYIDSIPKARQGHGHVNAYYTLMDQPGVFEELLLIKSSSSPNDEYDEYNFTVPSGYKEVKATLVFSDDATKDSVQDLDLHIYDADGNSYRSTGYADTVEEVKITDAEGVPGNWTAKVRAYNVNRTVYYSLVVSVRLADPSLSLSTSSTVYTSPSSSFQVSTSLTNAGFATVGSYVTLYNKPSGFTLQGVDILRHDGLSVSIPTDELYYDSTTKSYRASLGEVIKDYPRKVTWKFKSPSTTGTYTLNFKYGALNTAEQSKSVSVEVSTLSPGTIDDFSSENGLTQSSNGGSWGDWTYYETSSSFDMDVKGSTTYAYGSGAGGKFRIGQGTDPYSDYVEIKREWPGQPFDTDAGYISVYLKRQNGYPSIRLKLEDTNGYEVRTSRMTVSSSYAEKIIDLTDFGAGQTSSFDWDNVKYITLRAHQRVGYNTVNDLYFDEITYTPSVPSPPTGLSVTDYGTNYIALNWNNNLRPEGVYKYYIYRDGIYRGQSTSSDYNDTGLSSGRNYCYNVTAINGKGESTLSAGVCRRTRTPPDTTPPSVSFTPSTPPDGAVLNQGYVYIEISASETLNNANLEWDGANESMSGSGTVWSRNKSAGDGTYRYKVWANDTAGNWGVSKSRNVTLDTRPPTGSILINDGDIYTTSTTVTLSLTYPADAYKVRYSNDGIWDTEPWENPTATKPWTLQTGDGTKTVYYQINDTAGRLSSTYNDSITLDTTPPTITIHSPKNTTYKTNSTALNYTAYDLNGISWVGYSLDGASNITITGNTTLTNLSDGQHNITLHASDTAGNPESKTVYFTIDTKETEVYIATLLPQTSLKPGDTLSTLIYLDNEGEIDDILTISIKGPSGTEVYQKNRYIYLEDDEGRFIRFSWSVPSDAVEGKYRLMTQLDETDSISSLKTFTINNTTAPPSNLTTFNLTLSPGWNLISIPVVPENTSLTSVLASIDGNYSIVYAWVGGGWKRSTDPRDPLAEILPEYGYWIYMTAPDTLEVSGAVPNSTTINVSTGWNLVGYPSLTSGSLTTVLSSINYSVVYAWIGGGWKRSTDNRSPLTEMDPGYGYWVYANETGSYEVTN